MAVVEALDEIQDRLNVIYNHIRLERESEQSCLLQAKKHRTEIERLDKLAEGYVALLRPTEGEVSA